MGKKIDEKPVKLNQLRRVAKTSSFSQTQSVGEKYPQQFNINSNNSYNLIRLPRHAIIAQADMDCALIFVHLEFSVLLLLNWIFNGQNFSTLISVDSLFNFDFSLI